MSDHGSGRESPLVRFGRAELGEARIANARVNCTERPFLGHINLRGDAGDAQFVAAIACAVGAAVPTTPNTVTHGDDNVVYWLGPDEWLIVTPTDKEGVVARALRAALAGLFVAVTEISGGQTVISLRGDAARELLAKGCPLDLHPRVFGVDRCAQSHLAKAPILIRQVDDAPSFEIVVRRSFADYLWTWLEDSAGEYPSTLEATPGSYSEPASTASRVTFT